MKDKGKKSFVVFHDWYEAIKDFNDEDLGKILRAMFEYEINRDVKTELDPVSSTVFKIFKQAFDRNREQYAETCKKATEAANERWREFNEWKKTQGKQ